MGAGSSIHVFNTSTNEIHSFLLDRECAQGRRMANLNDRFPDNVVGAFYVDTECICCGICGELAPAFFRPAEDGGHHVVFRQPEGADEIEVAREAMGECPVEAIGDDG